jgi:histidyl-tRNA synthetase
MRDFLPDAVRRRQYVIGVVTDVYERYGFEPLETPAVENLETLLGKYGEEGNQLIFKILKRGEHEASGRADLALRYDLTVPLARVVAQYRGQLPRFFRRYQIQPVWRADRPARGRFREFYQCDVDALGSRSMSIETELCAAASDVLDRLGFADFSIRLNHRRVLTGILDAAGVPSERHGDALVALDKLDKIGADGVQRELADRGLAATGGEALLGFLGTLGAMAHERAPDGSAAWNDEALGRIARFVGDHEGGRQGIDELRTIVALVACTSASGRVRIDATFARGLSYYTGAIMEVAVPDLAGSLGGGGRYDNLVGMFLGEDVPACGFSLGLERIIVVMMERGMFPPAATLTPADVMVTVWSASAVGESLALARELRNEGLRVEVYPDADRLGKQFRYAASRGVPFVAVLGDDERARNLVAIKDMKTGEQRAVARADAARALKP